MWRLNPPPPTWWTSPSGEGVQIYVHDLQTGSTEIVSTDNTGTQLPYYWTCSPSISGDGRFVAFASCPDGPGPVLLKDRNTGILTVVAASSAVPSVSVDGRFVAYVTTAHNLNPIDTFVFDRLSGETTQVSVSKFGNRRKRKSDYPSISADGRFVAFESDATNLVPNDTNGMKDVFVRDLGPILPPAPAHGRRQADVGGFERQRQSRRHGNYGVVRVGDGRGQFPGLLFVIPAEHRLGQFVRYDLHTF